MLSFQEIRSAASPHFPAAIKIYNEAFPVNERHPNNRIEERLTAGLNQLHVGLSDGQVVFMALLWPLRETHFTLLDYMATRADKRGQGIGSAFMRQMALVLQNKNQHLILEVEDPDYGDNPAQRRMRMAFYCRNGARLLQGLRYVLPPLQGDKVTEMNLMMLPPIPNGVMEGELAKNLIARIYKELYGRNPDDPLLNTFISDIPATIPLT